MVAVLSDMDGFVVVLSVIAPLPFPLAGETVNQLASLLADVQEVFELTDTGRLDAW